MTDDQGISLSGKFYPGTWSVINLKFRNAFANWLAISKVADRNMSNTTSILDLARLSASPSNHLRKLLVSRISILCASFGIHFVTNR
jgi:hypothetical protein